MNDLISRQAAVKALQDKVFHNLSDEFYGAMQVLDELPTVDAEPVKHGKWIEKPTIAYCSCCHIHWTKSFLPSLRKTYKFCPHCGAKMDGGKGE